MIQSITFGDKNTWDDWHLLPTERPVFAPPSVKTSYVDVPGGNGSLDLSESLTGYPVYNNRTGSFKFRVMNGYGEWADRYSEIMEYLHGQSMRAVLADDRNWFYQGRFTVDEWASADTWSEITIGYNVSPFKWNLLSSTEDWLWDPFNFQNGIIWPTTFKEIEINDANNYITKSFSSKFFLSVPISPTFIVSDDTKDANNLGNGIDIKFVNTYLGIEEEINCKDGETFVPDFVIYGQTEPYEFSFRGNGTVSIDFRVGRL